MRLIRTRTNRLPRLRLPAGRFAAARRFFALLGRIYGAVARRVGAAMPKGLFARALIIIIAPIVLLQSFIAYTFMERHWQTVTMRLSSAVTADIAALIDIYETFPQDEEASELIRIADQRLGLDVEILRDTELPPPGPKPFFSILDQALSSEIARQVERPFWIDTVGRSDLIEIRIRLDDGIMRVITERSQAYASNSHIFLLWMGGTSLVLMGIAIIFLRNQIRPILRLAEAAESFGKGREIEFRPRGAARYRAGGPLHFIEIEAAHRARHRSTYRDAQWRSSPICARSSPASSFSLALLEPSIEVRGPSERDVDEMSRCSKAPRLRPRRFRPEQAVPTDLAGPAVGDLALDAERQGHPTRFGIEGRFRRWWAPDCVGLLSLQPRLQRGRHGDTDRRSAPIPKAAGARACNVDDDGAGHPPGAAR